MYRNNVRKDEDIIHAIHVKGEKTYGKPRDVPALWDDGEILERYLVVRDKKLKAWGKISDALFLPLRCNTPFLSSNAIIVLEKLVEMTSG